MSKVDSVYFDDAFISEPVGKLKIKESEYDPSGSICVVDQGQKLISGYTNRTDVIRENGPYIVFGDHTRVIKYIEFPFVVGADGVRLYKAADGYNLEFLYLFLKSVSLPVDSYGRHSKYLKEVKVPKLDKKTQSRIAACLKTQLAEVEKACQAEQVRLAAAKFLPMALFRQTFTGPNTSKWSRLPFGQVVMLQRGHDLTGQNREPGPYPVVTSSGIVGTHCEFRAKGPGVVTGRSGSIGLVHYIDGDYWPHNTALYVKNFFGNNPRYIYYLMQWLNVKAVSSGTGVPTLDRKEVHKIVVSHPKIEEQKRIVQELDDKLAIIIQAQKSLEAELKDINMLPVTILRQAFEM